MIAHTLGNPFDLDAVTAFCDEHDLWLVEDCCDAVGSTYDGQHVGTFGDLATVELLPRPPHDDGRGRRGPDATRAELKVLAESFRDWGRDCWCEPGKDNTCGKRFDWQLGDAAARLRPQVHLLARRLQPEAHRHAGGGRRRAARQARRLRRRPPAQLRAAARGRCADLRGVLRPARGDAELATRAGSASRSPCGPRAPFDRNEVVRYLEERKIATRLLFARQPRCASRPTATSSTASSATCANTDFVMNDVFWVGVYPGLTEAHIDYMAQAHPRRRPRRVGEPGLLERSTCAPDGAHGLQGELARALAAQLGAEVTGFALDARRATRRCSTSPASARGCSPSRVTSATWTRCARSSRLPARGHPAPGGQGDRARVARGPGQHLRDERHGHGAPCSRPRARAPACARS